MWQEMKRKAWRVPGLSFKPGKRGPPRLHDGNKEPVAASMIVPAATNAFSRMENGDRK